MKKFSDIKNKFIDNCWYSSWGIAIRIVLTEWITGVALILIGIWIAHSLFSFSVLQIIDFLPEQINLFIAKNINVISKVCILVILISFAIQTKSKQKLTNQSRHISDLKYNKDKSFESRIKFCELNIFCCEKYKETLLFERELIKSCSPIPIVATLLGYVIEKVGLINFNWHIYVIICIFLILFYIFLCIRILRKFRDIQFKINKWQETKTIIEIAKE